MILRPRNWEPVGVRLIELYSELSSRRDMPSGHKTEVLYRRKTDGKLKVRTLRGTWTLEQLQGGKR